MDGEGKAGRSTEDLAADCSRESPAVDAKRHRNGLLSAESTTMTTTPNRTPLSSLNGSKKNDSNPLPPDDSVLSDLVVRLERCQALAAKLTGAGKADHRSVAEVSDKVSDKVSDDLARLSVKDEDACAPEDRIRIVQYIDETQMADIMRLITKDLSEPYSIYTYRYFIHKWPELCLLAYDTVKGEYVGSIVCKLDLSRQNRRRGYIAMLAVDENCRRLRIGTRLVVQAIENMQKSGCDEVVLETEVTNLNALRLYQNLGFVREKRLFRYYLNGVDAFRLKLFLAHPPDSYYFYDGAL
uniref:N-terminal methionine N(alpha)-acetyltransferase NatC n=2 Tax=Plectus sambesii TaxID=2011161 RepID=A0A914VEU9_9BILA